MRGFARFGAEGHDESREGGWLKVKVLVLVLGKVLELLLLLLLLQ